MKIGNSLRLVAVGSAGFLAGSLLTFSLQGSARIVARPERSTASGVPLPRIVPEEPQTFLAWTPGGLPGSFGRRLDSLRAVRRSVIVASDNTWLTRSESAQGEIVDRPKPGFAIPLEVAAVSPPAYAPFLPPPDRGVALSLAEGQGVLGASSAQLRGLGPGAVLWFGSVRVEVAAVLPDELVGAHELMVSRATGRRIGVRRDRYALIQPRDEATDRSLTREIRPLLPPGLPVRVRAPGETPYFRQGDAVLPPVKIKELFGEFSARPDPARSGYLIIDASWEREHIMTEHVPLLGTVTCNVALFRQIRGVIHELIAEHLASAIQSFSGCYARRFTNRDPDLSISHHSWGIALDINVPQNPFGAPPHQDRRMVRVFERWGFIWGGTFLTPDGMHFEYRRPPSGRLPALSVAPGRR
ncbi:MAG TPA: M15 family metallopeptidase [Actinomycetota bacterium]|nr:M15 family metallopeptidase [Actinomycetota bacterium]